MTNEHFVLEPLAPWSTTQSSVSSGLPFATDPREGLSDQALVLASQNAYPVVATQKSRRDSLIPVAGAAIAVVLGVATFASMSGHRSQPMVTGNRQQLTQTAPQARQFPSFQPATSGYPALTNTTPPASGLPAPPMMYSGSMAGMAGTTTMPRMSHGGAPIMVYDTGSAPSTVTENQSPNLLSASGGPGLLAGGSMVQGNAVSEANSAHSTTLQEPSNTIAQGTLIPAVLETAIQSDLSGYARAVVSQDIRSFDGSKILVPRSSRLIGEYKGSLTSGQNRVYLMWTRLIRPDGVSIALASPAVDASGQSGIGGHVNDHFLQRFGSAILLSLLGGVSALGSGGATVVVSGGQSAASSALQRDGQRAPTVRVRQGEPIRVFTARDLIFASDDGAKG
jgi:type IV secretion system protein VirB10